MWRPLSMAEPHVCAPIDANGNLSSDGTRTFEWDARNQLLAASAGTLRSEFSYDGRQHRVQFVQKENAIVQSDTKMLWCQNSACEERGSGGTVVRRSFTHSDQVDGSAQLFFRDHLGTSHEIGNSAGLLAARYSFDPWGRRTLSAGTDVSTFSYTGHRWEPSIGLSLAMYRGYDAELGRWLSEDPAGAVDGPNLYSYVRNSPVGKMDPLGLCSCNDECPSGRWFVSSLTYGLGKILFGSGGAALIRCDGKPWVFQVGKIFCATTGLYGWWPIGGGVALTINWYGPREDLNACNRSQLKPFPVKGYIVDFGPVHVQKGSIGFGLGPTAGYGDMNCQVTP